MSNNIDTCRKRWGKGKIGEQRCKHVLAANAVE
jgi:hypothetical protein